MPVSTWRERIDAFQQRHVVLAFPFAVNKRFSEDRGRHYAALLSYYGFFSLFPLLLAFVSLLGVILRGRPGLQHDILDSALGRFPVIGTQLAGEGALSGNGWALAFGLAAAVWAGLGVVYAAQDAMDTMWDVPLVKRPGFVAKRLRALALPRRGGDRYGSRQRGRGYRHAAPQSRGGCPRATTIGTVVINVASLLVGFMLLTVAHHRWRTLLPGAIAGGVALMLVQVLGSWYLTRW